MSNRLELPESFCRILNELIRQHIADVEVWAYGSRVNGRCHSGSDLDLVLRAQDLQRMPDQQLGDFKNALHESAIPILVDVMDWERIPATFHRDIEKEYVSIYSPVSDNDSQGFL